MRVIHKRSPSSQPLRFRTCRRARQPSAIGLSISAFAVAAALADGASAQEATGGDFSVQRMEGAPGPGNFIVTRGARVDGQMDLFANALVHYGHKPFVVVSCRDAENCSESAGGRSDVNVVENLGTADLMGSLTVIPIVQVGLRVPVTWVQGEGLDEDGRQALDGLSGVGLGDVEVEGKVRAFGNPQDPFVLGGALFVTAPTGHLTSSGNYLGDELPTAGLRGIGDVKMDKLHLAGNLIGYWRDKAELGSYESGPGLRFSAAAAYQVMPVFAVMADVFGGTQFSGQNDGSNTMEAALAAQITPLGSPLKFLVGGGTGLTKGVGVPVARGFIGFSYSFESSDRDLDGITGASDECPTDAEDMDGYEDSDGCPDLDNDQDTILDVNDKCPMDAEDPDGFEDTDGCPDYDNDKDGVPDDRDACPNEPETKNGYKDDDGCPDEVDSDEDGVPDSRDACPNEPEDTDGFEDTDGCPDLDNDQDGVPDLRDECYLEPETINGFEDEDGCPDEPPEGWKPPPGWQPPQVIDMDGEGDGTAGEAAGTE